MNNFLNKNKKNENKENKEVQKNLKSKEENKNEVALLPTDKFKNMVYLKEFLTPQTPAILTAGDKDSYNSMAIEWGLIGVVWKMPLFSVFVKDERYTYEFMKKTKIFTVSLILKKHMKGYKVYGWKSGRDINKEEESGYHMKFLDDGGITFEEAKEFFVCKVVSRIYLTEDDVEEDIHKFYDRVKQYFKNTTPHAQFIGKIIGHYKKEGAE